MSEKQVSERAAELCEQAIVWDGHAGFEFSEGIDLMQLVRWKRSGVTYLSVNVASLVSHIEHIAGLIGIESVGISLDYDLGQIELESTINSHANYWPKRQYPNGSDIGFLEPEAFPRIADALLERGYSEAETRGVLGENFLRVAAEVWD